RTQAGVRRSAAAVRRASTRDLLRRTENFRRQFHACGKRHARRDKTAAVVVARHADGHATMTAYITRRLLLAVVLVFAVSSASLLLVRLSPGDYVTETLGAKAKRADVEAARERYGLNRSFAEQYGSWLAGILRFDFGRSMQYDRPVTELIPERAANTGI